MEDYMQNLYGENMTNKRKPGQSQLDYLWVNFGNLEVSNQPNLTSPDETILTESAVINEIKRQIDSVEGLDETKYYNKEEIDELIPQIETITEDDVDDIINEIFN